MNPIFFIVCGVISVMFLSDGIATLTSNRYYDRRQKMLRLEIKAPQHLDANKYLLVNKILSGVASLGAGVVPLIWILQYLNAAG